MSARRRAMKRKVRETRAQRVSAQRAPVYREEVPRPVDKGIPTRAAFEEVGF